MSVFRIEIKNFKICSQQTCLINIIQENWIEGTVILTVKKSCVNKLALLETKVFCHFSIKIFYKLIAQTNCIILQTPSCQRPPSYRNQSIYLQGKSVDWFLFDRDLRYKRVTPLQKKVISWSIKYILVITVWV